MVSLADYLIDKKIGSCAVELNECSTDWKGRFHKIVKDSILVWGEHKNLSYFIFLDAPKQLNMYYISSNLQILIDEYDNLQGFCLLQA